MKLIVCKRCIHPMFQSDDASAKLVSYAPIFGQIYW